MIREQLEEALLRQEDGASACSLLLVDLDRFKLVNDTLGHSVGDQLLCEVAHRLQDCAGEGACIGRLGGDEFAIVWFGDHEDVELAELSDLVISSLSQPFVLNGSELTIGATIGVARSPRDGRTQEELTRSADLALYRAKEAGRGSFQFFDAGMIEEARSKRQLESDLRGALQTGGLTLAFQPIVEAANGAVMGQEALLRWNHPERGDIAPDLFVPVIEDVGLISQVGSWVIREACAEAASWPEHIHVAVNVSAAQLAGSGLAATVVQALASSGLSPERLELEITESLFLGNDAATLDSLERLRMLGVRLVLDDFGTGYSSFGYLARARFHKIKIDKSFVHAVSEGSRQASAIVEAITALAHGLGLVITAEGVESAEQATLMRLMGCDLLQGYYFGRPELSRPRLALEPSELRRKRA
jgi:diguanylate cyclase (GGDEF)-like protein